MKILANVIWCLMCNSALSVFYFVAGLLYCLTVVGIPYGKLLIKFGIYTLVPFSREEFGESRVEMTGPYAKLLALPWFLLFRWYIALIQIIFIFLNGSALFTFPFAIQHFLLLGESYYLFENPWKKR